MNIECPRAGMHKTHLSAPAIIKKKGCIKSDETLLRMKCPLSHIRASEADRGKYLLVTAIGAKMQILRPIRTACRIYARDIGRLWLAARAKQTTMECDESKRPHRG